MSDEQKPKEVKPIIIELNPELVRSLSKAILKGIEVKKEEGKLKDEDEDKNDEDI